MARPRKEGMSYFPHDTDAVNDEKIEALRALYGNDGYAFYFILLERIYRTKKAELDISKPVVREALIVKIGVSSERFEEMIATSLELQVFDKKEYERKGILTSDGIKKRASEVLKMRKKWRNKKAVFPGENPVDNQVDNTLENAEETGERKEKKSKVNDPRVRPVIDYFFNKYKERLGSTYPVQGAKDGSLIKAIDKDYNTEAICKMIDLFFDDKDPFIWDGAGPSIGLFYSRLPGLVAKLKRKGASSSTWEPDPTLKRLREA